MLGRWWGNGEIKEREPFFHVLQNEISSEICQRAHCHSWYLWLLACCSIAKLYLTLCVPMDCSMQGFPILHYLLEFVQTQVHWVSDAIQPSHSLSPPFLLLSLILPTSGAFPVSRLFTSGDQSIGALASASVLPMNIQDWFSLGLTGLISLQSKRLSRVFPWEDTYSC